MKFLQNLSIARKVVAAFSLVLVVALALGLFAVDRLAQVNAAAAEIRDSWLVATGALGEAGQIAIRFRQIEATHLLAPTPAEKASEEATMTTLLGELKQAWARYTPTIAGADEQKLADEMTGGWRHYLELHEKFVALSRAGDTAATELYRGEMRRAFNAVIFGTLAKESALNLEGGRTAAAAAEQTYLSARRWIVGALMFAALLCIAAGLAIVTGVSRPIRGMTETMARLAKHELETEIVGVGRKDEIGHMAAAVQVFRDSMVEADRLAAAQRAEEEKKEERRRRIETAVAAFDQTVRGLLETLASASTELRSTAESMASIAEEASRQSTAVSAASEQASANVQTVASATEEMTASIGEISRQVGQSNDVAGTIAGAVEEQSATSKEITRNTQEAARGTEDVTRNIAGVSQAAQETGAAASQVLGASDTLSRQSEGLRKEVADFLAEIRSA